MHSTHPRSLLLFGFLATFPSLLSAGTPFELAELARPFVSSYDVRSGLPHSTVQALLVDPSNRLWIGTQNGLVVYDGRSFEEVRLPSNDRSRLVRCLAWDRTSVWVGTQAGGLFERRPTGSWRIWGPGNAGEGPSDPRISILLVDRENHPGEVWVGTHHSGLWRYNGERW
jgi:ligand-binding sensor domain-containing protein